MLELRAGNKRCRECSVTPVLRVGVSALVVGYEDPEISVFFEKPDSVELAER